MIKVKNLSFGYSKKSLLFHNLNFELSKGHIYGLLGKNGAGKSTLLRNMVGLSFPQKGSCQINGKDVAKRSPELLADIYFIPEEVYVPPVSIASFVAATAPFYPHFNPDQFYTYLADLEVPREAILNQISYGQQKKVIIAFGVATNTTLLVLDEPTNGLDIPSKMQFRKIIASALTEDRCIIIATHQVKDLENLIDTLIVLHDKQIVLQEELDIIAENLTFTTLNTTEGLAPLYAEDFIGGKLAILPNTQGTYSRVDIELLFKAITSDAPSILNPFNQKHREKSV